MEFIKDTESDRVVKRTFHKGKQISGEKTPRRRRGLYCGYWAYDKINLKTAIDIVRTIN